MSDDYLAQLNAAVRERSTEEARQWLDDAYRQLDTAADPVDTLSLLSARSRRKLGLVPLGAGAADIVTDIGPVPIAAWPLGDAGRVALLLAGAAHHPQHAVALADGLFRGGDEIERAVVIRALALVSADDGLKHLALEVGRTNSVALFAALARHNPYPAARYSDHEFNQMILKALFIGVNIDAVHGLELRANADLSRMCEDYIDERRAAGRDVPADIWLALGPHASAGGNTLMLTYLEDQDPSHRYYAAVALGRRMPEYPEFRHALRSRLKEEGDERTRAALDDALSQSS